MSSSAVATRQFEGSAASRCFFTWSTGSTGVDTSGKGVAGTSVFIGCFLISKGRFRREAADAEDDAKADVSSFLQLADCGLEDDPSLAQGRSCLCAASGFLGACVSSVLDFGSIHTTTSTCPCTPSSSKLELRIASAAA